MQGVVYRQMVGASACHSFCSCSRHPRLEFMAILREIDLNHMISPAHVLHFSSDFSYRLCQVLNDQPDDVTLGDMTELPPNIWTPCQCV